MIALSGLEQDDIEIVYTGLRPGEKLFEELYFEEEHRVATRHPKVFCAMHRPADIASVDAVFEELAKVVDESPEVVRARLRDLVPEYAAIAGVQPLAIVTEELRKSRVK
jgi:FlaA1/EpsC-like NDP-sugar epimerase